MATSYQLQLVADEIRRLCADPHKGWMRNGDPDAAIAYIQATARGETGSTCCVIDGVFLMYTTGRQWWASKPVLAEELMLRIEPGFLATPLAFLERTAQLLDCAGVVLGTSISTNDAALMRLYRRYGYVESANALYKEV